MPLCSSAHAGGVSTREYQLNARVTCTCVKLSSGWATCTCEDQLNAKVTCTCVKLSSGWGHMHL